MKRSPKRLAYVLDADGRRRWWDIIVNPNLTPIQKLIGPPDLTLSIFRSLHWDASGSVNPGWEKEVSRRLVREPERPQSFG